jgi:hypothetical protein
MIEAEYPPPFSLPSGSTQWLFQGPAAESKFLQYGQIYKVPVELGKITRVPAVKRIDDFHMAQTNFYYRHDGSWLPFSERQLQYLETFGNTRKRVVLLGMNPGPCGMAQTGAPFDEIAAVGRGADVTGGLRFFKRHHQTLPEMQERASLSC